MVILALLPLVLGLSSAAEPRATLPVGASIEGLFELTSDGEVMILPAHDHVPFNALLASRYRGPCRDMEKAMLDVEGYPRRWNVKNVTVQERTPTKVRYEMQLGIALAPTLKGLVENPRPGRIIFHDVDTGAQFIWSMTDAESGCQMLYSMLEAPGKPSGFVSVIRAIEPSAGDAANFAAALSSTRGYTRPDEEKGAPRVVGPAGLETWTALADAGTAMRMLRAPQTRPRVVTRRRITTPVNEVLWSIRHRSTYDDKLDIVHGVEDRGTTVRWSFGYFGGRVNVTTRVTESGKVDDEAGLVIREVVTGGDLPDHSGSWTWHVKKIDGGTDVELLMDLDLIPGSTILSTLASADPITRESLGLQVAMDFMGTIIGGRSLGKQSLAATR